MRVRYPEKISKLNILIDGLFFHIATMIIFVFFEASVLLMGYY